MFYYDWLHILRVKYKVITIILFLFAGIYGIWNGYSLYNDRITELDGITVRALNAQNEARTWFETDENGTPAGPWVDGTAPVRALWQANVFETHAPSFMMTYSIGQAEQFGYYKRMTMWSTPLDGDLTAEIANPERVVSGSLDFGFVWLILMPLLLIILLYDIGGLEKDLGIKKLLSVQIPSEMIWLLQRVGVVALLITLSLIAFVLLPALISGYLVEFQKELLQFFLIASLYQFLWVVLFALVIFFGKSRTQQAIFMLGFWLFIAIIIPGTVHQITHLNHPTGYMLEYINAQREDRHHIFEQEYNTVLQTVGEQYPALAETRLALKDEIPTGSPRQSIYRMAVMLHMEDVFRIVVENQTKRNDYIWSTALFNPVMAVQNRMNTIAGTDFYSDRTYRERIMKTGRLINELILFDDWNEVVVDAPRFSEYIDHFKH